MLEKGGFLRHAYNWGRIIGYATMEVVSFVLLAGASAMLKGSRYAGRLAKLVKVIEEVPAIQKVVEGAAKLSKTKAARIIAEQLGTVKKAGKAVLESKPVRMVGKAVGKTAGAAGAIAAAPGRALIKTAEWIRKGIEGLAARYGKSARRVGAAAEVSADAAAAGDAFSQAQARARTLAKEAQAKGGPVVANIGGAGAPHEYPGAINVNNMAVPRKNIPNLVVADGSDVGELFEAGSLDRIEAFRIPSGAIDWNRAAPGSFRALKSGGRFEFAFYGPSPDAEIAEAALRAAGFDRVSVQSKVLITAVKP
jgi:hypothetical protein